MEVQLAQETTMREHVNAELTKVKEMCIKLDKQKDNLTQQLHERDSHRTQVMSSPLQYPLQLGN